MSETTRYVLANQLLNCKNVTATADISENGKKN